MVRIHYELQLFFNMTHKEKRIFFNWLQKQDALKAYRAAKHKSHWAIYKLMSIYDPFITAFPWSETPQGLPYWAVLDKKWEFYRKCYL